jgi:hypothetical protein
MKRFQVFGFALGWDFRPHPVTQLCDLCLVRLFWLGNVKSGSRLRKWKSKDVATLGCPQCTALFPRDIWGDGLFLILIASEQHGGLCGEGSASGKCRVFPPNSLQTTRVIGHGLGLLIEPLYSSLCVQVTRGGAVVSALKCSTTYLYPIFFFFLFSFFFFWGPQGFSHSRQGRYYLRQASSLRLQIS